MTLNSRWVYPESRLHTDPPNSRHREALKTAPTSRVISAADLDAFGRLDGLYPDAQLEAAIDSATAFMEQGLGRALLTQTWQITLEGQWPLGGVVPWRQPYQSLTSITTVRPEAVNVTWTADMFYEMPGPVWKATSAAPGLLGQEDYWMIEYVAGHDGDASDPVEPALVQALQIIAHEHLVWNRDIGNTPGGWPAASWDLAAPYMAFRGVG